MSYIYGLTNKIKKNLLKAEECLNKASELNEYSQPYYAMYIYRVRKKLFKLGAFEDINDLIQIGNEVFKIYEKYKDFKNYGNSFYYMFGKLYEKGIGTQKNNKMAFLYYQKGCRSLLNLSDSFIIVYKRYLSLKITKSMVMKSSANNNIPSFLAYSSPSFNETCLLDKSFLFPTNIIIESSILFIKEIHSGILVNEDLFDISYTKKTIEEFLIYDGIKLLYFSCPAESQI